MADVKISALPASTTPLAGTEVLPIVQGGVTKQVSVDNLTAGKAVSVGSLTSDGNVGIGTSSPFAKLQVVASSADYFNPQLMLGEASNATGKQLHVGYNTTADTGYIQAVHNGTGYKDILLQPNGGNLGLGVTPSAWSYKAIDVSNSGSFYGDGVVQTWAAGISQNAYYNSGWKYRFTGHTADRYEIGGGHFWYIAPSGTAGNAISFTQAMTLDASGNWLLGTTSSSAPTGGFAVVPNSNATFTNTGHVSGTATGSAYSQFWYNSSIIGSITQNGTTGVLYNIISDYRLKTFVSQVSGSGERIDALNPVEFEWKADGRRSRGFFAHEFQSVYADSVTGEKDAVDEEGKPVYQQMQASTNEVIADLVAELKSLRARVAQLESKG